MLRRRLKEHSVIFTKNLIFSLPCYESLPSNTTKDQNTIKNIMDKAYQRQPPDDYHSNIPIIYKIE